MNTGQIRTIPWALFFFIGFLYLASCQKILGTFTPVYYNIANNTNNQLSVFYAYNPHDGGQPYDSILTIEAGQKRTLVVQLFSYHYAENPESEDTLRLITQLLVFDSDSVVSQKNFRLTKYWKFSEYATKSELGLNINSHDF